MIRIRTTLIVLYQLIYLSVGFLGDVNIFGSVGLTPPLVVPHFSHQLQFSLWFILFFIWTKTHTIFMWTAPEKAQKRFSFTKITATLSVELNLVKSHLFGVWTPNLRRDRRWRTMLPSVHWWRRPHDCTEPIGRQQWDHTRLACGSEARRPAHRSTDLIKDQTSFTS